MFFSMQILLVSLVHLWVLSNSHRSLPEGVTCGNQFANASVAMPIPNPKISWASYRIVTCDAPVTWWKGEADAGQMLSFTAGIPAIARFNTTRLAIVVIGPGLPNLTTSQKSRVPSSILAQMEELNQGGVLVESPEDQSTCAHVMSQMMRDSTAIKDGRCNFHEEYTDSNSWTVIDDNVTTVSAGTHHFAMYSIDDTTAKMWFACCDWPEDFGTFFEMPVADCPYCGTKGSFGNWNDHFYESRGMAQYGGFPAFTHCATNRTRPYPSLDQCPDEQSSKPKPPTQCQLGCSQGTCHSHNVFGECTYEMGWFTPHPKLGNANVTKLMLFVNETIFFTSAGHYFPHNLVEMQSEANLESCNFTERKEIGRVDELKVGKPVKFTKAGTYYYSCEITNHCSYGQKLTVEVKDVSEGTHCHAHEERECPGGEVKAYVIGSQTYGASSNDECSELCTAEAGIQWMAGASKGSCADSDFDVMMKKVQVQPTGSPAMIDVTIMGKAEACASGQVMARVIANEDYGAKGDQCSQLCTTAMALQWMAGAEQGSCKAAGYSKMVKDMQVDLQGSPQKMPVKIMAKPTTCHCHSYENIECNSNGDALYDEHVDEIMEYCQGVVSNTDSECPYKCFQPFEIMHIHYMECSLRSPHPLYLQIANASVNCHLAAPADADTCGSTGSSTSASPAGSTPIGSTTQAATFLGTSTNVATVTTTNTATEVLGSTSLQVTMTVRGVNHAQLVQNQALQEKFEMSVKETLASQAGSEILPRHVSLTLSAGSVVIEATILPPASVDANSLYQSLIGSGTQVATAVANGIKSIPGIDTVSSGEITADSPIFAMKETEDGTVSGRSYTSVSTLGLFGMLTSFFWL